MKIQFKPNPKPPPSVKKAKKPINKQSAKRKAKNGEYASKKAEFFKLNPFCQKGLQGCQGIAIDIHHTKGGKDREETYLDISTWMAVCRNCHRLIHDKNL